MPSVEIPDIAVLVFGPWAIGLGLFLLFEVIVALMQLIRR